MKIIYSVHQFFPKHYTGTERYVLNLATMMQKLGHEVCVVTYQPNQMDAPQSTQDEVQIEEYTYENVRVVSLKCTHEHAFTSFDLKNEPIRRFFTKFLKLEKPDIFHIAHPMRMGSAFWAAKDLKIKTVITLTDYWMMCGKGILLRNNSCACSSPKNGHNCKKYCYSHLPLSQLRDRVVEARQIVKNASGIIASANFLVNVFKFNWYDLSKLTLIRHGFNYFDNYTPVKLKPHKLFTIVSTGSLLPHKGVHQLIEAFRKIPLQHLRLKIYGTTYGNVDYMDYLLKLAGRDKRISFVGTYSITDTSRIHDEADLVVQPSLWFETYPLTGVAALAYGVPIVVPDLTGAAELVIPGNNGYIYTFGDVSSLSAQLSKAAADNLKMTQRISYSQSIESEAVSTEKLYYQVLT